MLLKDPSLITTHARNEARKAIPSRALQALLPNAAAPVELKTLYNIRAGALTPRRQGLDPGILEPFSEDVIFTKSIGTVLKSRNDGVE